MGVGRRWLQRDDARDEGDLGRHGVGDEHVLRTKLPGEVGILDVGAGDERELAERPAVGVDRVAHRPPVGRRDDDAVGLQERLVGRRRRRLLERGEVQRLDTGRRVHRCDHQVEEVDDFLRRIRILSDQLDAVLRRESAGRRRLGTPAGKQHRAKQHLLAGLEQRDLVELARRQADQRIELAGREVIVKGVLIAVLEVHRTGVARQHRELDPRRDRAAGAGHREGLRWKRDRVRPCR